MGQSSAIPRRASRQQARNSTATHGGSMHDHPIGALSLGLGILFFALWGISVQLETSEAWYTGSQVTASLYPHFSVFGQLLDFFNGHLKDSAQMQAVTYAWGVEILQFVFSIGIELPKHNRLFNWIFWIGNVTTIGLNSLSDYFFNSAANPWQQIGFTLVTFLLSFGLLYCALHLLIRKGIIELVLWFRP
jgi:hypothetical protein